MSKVNLPSIPGGYLSLGAMNSRLAAIEAAFDNTLSLDGSVPNTLAADVDLNGSSLLNVHTINATNYAGLIPEAVAGNAIELVEEAATEANAATVLLVDDAEGFRDEAEGFRNESSTFATAAQNSIIAGTTIFESVSEAQAQTNALLGLGIGSSSVNAEGELIMSYYSASVTDLYIDADGFLTIEY